jgi:hypothetical protein
MYLLLANTAPRSRKGAAIIAVAAAGVLVLLAQTAAAQSTVPVEKPGVFESIGRWFDQGAANFRSHLRGAKERMDNLGDKAAADTKEFNSNAAEAGKDAAVATKNAVDAVVRLPTSRVMSGHERCALAPNGAPDCISAAETLCRKHGFESGKSIDFTSAEQCPTRAWLGGRQSAADCTTVTFINRAMCQ